MALATTCPQCKTSFKVVPDQLKLKRGLVRCGVCQNVFSGIDYLRHIDDAARLPASGAQARPRPSAPAQQPAEPTQAPQTVIDDDDLKTAFFLPEQAFAPTQPGPAAGGQDDPPEASRLPASADPLPVAAPPAGPSAATTSVAGAADAAQSASSGAASGATATADASDAAASADASASRESARRESRPRGSRRSGSSKSRRGAARDAKEAARVVPDPGDPALIRTRLRKRATEPYRSDRAAGENEGAAVVRDVGRPSSPSARLGLHRPPGSAEATGANGARTGASTDAGAPPVAEARRSGLDTLARHAHRDARRLDRQRRDERDDPFAPAARTAPAWLTRQRLRGLVVGLAFVLAVQLILGARNHIAARAPLLGPVLSVLVAPFGLRIEPPRDLSALTIESFELQGSRNPEVLRLSALLRNRAGHVAAWPAMELTLTDSVGAVLARKVIAPGDYLPPDAPAGLDGRSERPIRLALEHRGLAPTGYSVALFYP